MVLTWCKWGSKTLSRQHLMWVKWWVTPYVAWAYHCIYMRAVSQVEWKPVQSQHMAFEYEIILLLKIVSKRRVGSQMKDVYRTVIHLCRVDDRPHRFCGDCGCLSLPDVIRPLCTNRWRSQPVEIINMKGLGGRLTHLAYTSQNTPKVTEDPSSQAGTVSPPYMSIFMSRLHRLLRARDTIFSTGMLQLISSCYRWSGGAPFLCGVSSRLGRGGCLRRVGLSLAGSYDHGSVFPDVIISNFYEVLRTNRLFLPVTPFSTYFYTLLLALTIKRQIGYCFQRVWSQLSVADFLSWNWSCSCHVFDIII
jgi:hypothetical protein